MKPQRKWRIRIIHIIIIIIVLILAYTAICAIRFPSTFRGPEICTDQQCFKIEIADTPKTREIGLMNRTSLDEDKGMLFVFEKPGQYSFRMKNTLIPLDMIRLDENYKIMYIQNSAQPCTTDQCPTYGNRMTAKYVLELKGGRVRELGLKVGESMEFKK